MKRLLERFLERVTPSGRRERRALQARVDGILAERDDAERRSRVQHIYQTYIVSR